MYALLKLVMLNDSLCEEASGVDGVSLTVTKWKALEQMVNQMYRVTGNPSCPSPHPGVTQLQTDNEPITSAENMLDLVPARGDSLSKLEQKLLIISISDG